MAETLSGKSKENIVGTFRKWGRLISVGIMGIGAVIGGAIGAGMVAGGAVDMSLDVSLGKVIEKKYVAVRKKLKNPFKRKS